uniref:Uncharacterized protein n=2 Tax=Ditylum brightwellii TaxID=49249 RepID=A0A7S4RPZ4_9STRA
MNSLVKSTMECMHRENNNRIPFWNLKESSNEEEKEEYKEEENWDDWSCSSSESGCDDSSVDSMSNEELDDLLRSVGLEVIELEITHLSLEIQTHKYERQELPSDKTFNNIPVYIEEEECGDETSLTEEEIKSIQEAASNMRQCQRHNRCTRNQKHVC